MKSKCHYVLLTLEGRRQKNVYVDIDFDPECYLNNCCKRCIAVKIVVANKTWVKYSLFACHSIQIVQFMWGGKNTKIYYHRYFLGEQEQLNFEIRDQLIMRMDGWMTKLTR